MRRAERAERAAAMAASEERVRKAIYASIQGLQIPVMKLGDVHREASAAVAEGLDDEAVRARVRARAESLAGA